MAQTTLSVTFDNLFTSTAAKMVKESTEQAFTNVPFLNWLQGKGSISKEQSPMAGYVRVEIPLRYGKNEALSWFGTGDTVPINDTQILTKAYDDWRNLSASIVRYGEEDRKNIGEARMLNYVQEKMMSARDAIEEELEEVLLNSDDTTNKPYGLDQLVSTTPTTGTVHNINRATASNSWFRNNAITSVGSYDSNLVIAMRRAKNTGLKYKMANWSDYAVFCHQHVHESYEDELLEVKRIYDNKMADLGFGGLQFDGVPLIWSPSFTAQQATFVNSKYIKLYYDPNQWFTMTDWKQIPNQVNDRVAQMVCSMQLCITRPIVMTVVSGITVVTFA